MEEKQKELPMQHLNHCHLSDLLNLVTCGRKVLPKLQQSNNVNITTQ